MKKLIFIISIISIWAAAFDVSARYRGDFNGDDRVDIADMVYLAKAIKSGTTDMSLDVNVSGSVDDYDLQKLADIIIAGTLTEDSGLNVGIGGWEDAGEDFGGTVNAPAFATRGGDDTRFYMRTPKSEGGDVYSMEFGISEGTEAPCAIFFNIRLPREFKFDQSRMIELESSITATHNLYGTPKFKKENEDDEWSEYALRFIVMSPDLTSLPEAVGKLGKIYYTPADCWGSPCFIDCQIAMPDEDGCTYIEDHWAGYDGNFMPVEVSSVWFEQTEISLTEGDEGWLYANIDPWDATDQNLVWSSSDESVATVSSEDGRNATIKAVKNGETIITASASNGVSATCKVTVKPILAESLTITPVVWSGEEGSTFTITATVLPDNTTDKSLAWESSDNGVATVDAEGNVSVMTPGECRITVSTLDGSDLTAECLVTSLAGIEQIFANPDATLDVYSPNGTMLKKSCTREALKTLTPGIYIIRTAARTLRIYLTGKF